MLLIQVYRIDNNSLTARRGLCPSHTKKMGVELSRRFISVCLFFLMKLRFNEKQTPLP
jgi:hypothetical protein